MPKILLITNSKLNEPSPNAEKFSIRKKYLEKNGWEVILGYISPPGDLRSYRSMRDIIRCLTIVIQKEIDIIHSFNEPMQLHGTGYLLSRITDVPWLMEFRDPLATNPEIKKGSIKKPIRETVEKLFIQEADKVIWIDGIQISNTYFQDEYPKISENHFTKLSRVGFDEEKFDRLRTKNFDNFTLTYAGSFYEGWIEPYPIFDALELFVEQHPEIEITVQFYGDWKPKYTTAAREQGVERYLSIHDWIDYDDLVPSLKGSDALLYIGGDDKRNKLNVPTKIYDYIGAQTPILAVVDHSFRVAKFIEDNKLGLVADPEEPTQIAEAIYELHTGTKGYDPDDISQFGREKSLQEFESILNALVD